MSTYSCTGRLVSHTILTNPVCIIITVINLSGTGLVTQLADSPILTLEILHAGEGIIIVSGDHVDY